MTKIDKNVTQTAAEWRESVRATCQKALVFECQVTETAILLLILRRNVSKRVKQHPGGVQGESFCIPGPSPEGRDLRYLRTRLAFGRPAGVAGPREKVAHGHGDSGAEGENSLQIVTTFHFSGRSIFSW